MYVPAHFAGDEQAVQQVLHHIGAADLITTTAQGLQASMLPWVYDLHAGTHGALLGHLARNNDQWRLPALGEALVIARGPDAYISPSWYPSKAEHHRVVPTWNYITAHIYGQLHVHDDPAWLEAQVRRLTERHEAGRAEPWSVDDAPAAFVAGQLRAIVGVEVRITRVEAKFKLSQNRPTTDMDAVIAELRHLGDNRSAAAVAAHRPR
ncbi:PaiB family negative transcriptional regulator [Micromonospora kangleipakensis]|uniref:PaiB family negative transcriptional regulator n=1 Tax=Micromonospora kangleipakensis TaxID=1077942 RepID=A0A4Q8BER4_9ACTN|nr:FMN-binding negative transcriptional regulator [Micromonospora kangleipakensis]RZU76198.1 PaiB family negative transcriptional regulator [Micromonospora kangleipakensis]